MRLTFIRNIQKFVKKDKNIIILTGDLGQFFDEFKNFHPDKFINVGVSESNMVGVAAGLALAGKKVYCYSIIPFLTMRAFEQIRLDVCLHNLDVKFLGAGGGLSYGLEGSTHHALEDVAIMRSLPNMSIVVPGDPFEIEAAANFSVKHKGPLYVRFGKDKLPYIHKSAPKFKIGKGIIINKGKNIAIIANGTMLHVAKIISDNLSKKGIKITLISMPFVKPIDINLIKNLSKNHKKIFTIEEHSVIGGLGDAVGDILLQNNFKGSFRKIGLPDEFSRFSGSHGFLLEKYGLTSEKIQKEILKNN